MPKLDRLDRQETLFVVLMGIFLTNALLAEVVGTKIFSLEAALGMAPLAWTLLEGQAFGFDLTAGVILWPIVFVTNDLINEYFGKRGVRRVSFLTAGFIAYAFVMIWWVAGLPPADFWVSLHAQGDPPLDIDLAFSRIFRQSMGIIIGSLVAFLIGQLLDVSVFQWVRRYTGSRHIWLRATGSTLVSQFVDSFVVLAIAFHYFGNPPWEWSLVISVGIVNYTYKFLVAIALTPVLYVAHALIDRYLGKPEAEMLARQASQSDFFG
ncbi:MAG: queuosine precursor transporter [Bernardetiaceae bacterium]